MNCYRQLLEETGYDEEKTAILIEGFTKGFDIGYRGPLERRELSRNIPITVGSEEEMWQKIMKEVKVGRYSGPFAESPYEHFIQSPLGLVPKANNQTRLIFHLSYNFGEEEDRKSVNYHTPEELCSVRYRDLDYAVRTCLALLSHEERNSRGASDLVDGEYPANIFFSKSDLRSAFRILPILPEQRKFLLMRARNPNTGNLAFFVENCLPFGASISCSNFQFFSDSLQHIIENITGRGFTVTNYLDDFLFIATTRRVCNETVQRFLSMCEEIGCPVSLEKTEWANELMVFLGILLNGINKTLSIPEEKIHKALNLLNWALQKKKVTVKFVQRLSGTLNFLNKAIVPGRAFTRGMYEKLKLKDKKGNPLKQFHHVNLGTSFLRDCEIWKYFLNNSHKVQLCRPFIDVEKFNKAEEINLYSDASLSAKRGMGAVFDDHYIVAKWSKNFIEMEKPSIAFVELYALVAAVLTWGRQPKMMNTRVIVFCDNESVENMINAYASGCPQCMKLIKILALDGLKYNRRVFVKHVETENNTLADALSRLQFDKFWRHAPKTMSVYPDVICERIFPVEKIWYNEF